MYVYKIIVLITKIQLLWYSLFNIILFIDYLLIIYIYIILYMYTIYGIYVYYNNIHTTGYFYKEKILYNYSKIQYNNLFYIKYCFFRSTINIYNVCIYVYTIYESVNIKSECLINARYMVLIIVNITWF